MTYRPPNPNLTCRWLGSEVRPTARGSVPCGCFAAITAATAPAPVAHVGQETGRRHAVRDDLKVEKDELISKKDDVFIKDELVLKDKD